MAKAHTILCVLLLLIFFTPLGGKNEGCSALTFEHIVLNILYEMVLTRQDQDLKMKQEQ